MHARSQALATIVLVSFFLSGCSERTAEELATASPTASTNSPTPSTTETVDAYLSYEQIREAQCALDSEAPAEWLEIQEVVKQQSNCFGPTRFVDAPESDYFPNSNYVSINLEQCKLSNINNYPRLGFSDTDISIDKRHPSPNTVFQVIPIYTNDATPTRTPKEDYGQYFNFLISWIKNTSDVASSAEIRVPDEYFYFDESLSSYPGIERHQKITPDGERFVDDVMGLVDKSIDFSGVDATIMIVPPETDNQLFGTNGWTGTKYVYDGNRILVNFMQTPIDLVNDEQDWQVNFTNPFTMIHELHHGGQDYGDHGENMGPYGLMTNSLTNLLVWEKWVSGFISDDQIACVSSTEKSVVAIAPTETKTNRVKGVVIPLSNTEVIVVESMRSNGYNYKLPGYATGAIVYRVDLTKTDHGEGVYLLTNPSLKVGQSIDVGGIIISVIDAGKFGDLVTIN